LLSYAFLQDSGIASARYRMMKINGRFLHTSIQREAGVLMNLLFDTRMRARTSPIPSDRIIAKRAIWRLMKKPVRMNRKLLPAVIHSQLAGSKR
jgi:hypothetical protein